MFSYIIRKKSYYLIFDMMQKETAEMATKKKELEIQIQGMTKTYQLQRGKNGSILVHA